jgi:hypothetical protein
MGKIGRGLRETDTCRALCLKVWNEKSLAEILWHEICSEYDARRFAQHIHESGMVLSREFLRFEKAWLRDENAHYIGFRNLYSIMYSKPAAELAKSVRGRKSGFSELVPFIEDEFRVCVLLAYDEMVTARAYAADFAIYDSLGDANLSQWLRKVCRDEIHHCLAMVELLRLQYRTLWFAKTSAGTKNRAVLRRVGLNTIIARYGMKTKTLKDTNPSARSAHI